MVEKTHYSRRFLARLLDLLLVGLILAAIQTLTSSIQINILLGFLLYNFVVILFNGRTIGKYLFALEVKTDQKGIGRIIRLFFREVLLIVLSPLLFINIVNMIPVPLHDRITGARVIKDGR